MESPLQDCVPQVASKGSKIFSRNLLSLKLLVYCYRRGRGGGVQLVPNSASERHSVLEARAVRHNGHALGEVQRG